MLEPRSRPCVSAALTLYSEILDSIEGSDFAVFGQRATVGNGRRLRVAGAGLLRSWRARLTQVASQIADLVRRSGSLAISDCARGVPGDHPAAGNLSPRRVSPGVAGRPRGAAGRRGFRACGTKSRSPRTSGPTTRHTSPV